MVRRKNERKKKKRKKERYSKKRITVEDNMRERER